MERLVWEKRQEELLRSSLRSSLLYDFIFGKLVNAREIYEKCRLLGIGTIPDAVLVLQIDELPRRTINRSEWYTYELRERVCQALEKAVADIPDAMMAVAGSGRLVLLLAAPHPESAGVEYLKTVADSLRQQVRSDTDLTVSVGIGGIVEDARRLHALSHIDLQVHPCEFLSLLGTSGCGKSTLLRIICGLEKASQGRIRYGGRTIEEPGPDRGMNPANKGSFGIWTAYRHLAYTTTVVPTYDSAIYVGEKGWDFGINYAFAKNITGDVEYFTGKQFDDNNSSISRIYTNLTFLF